MSIRGGVEILKANEGTSMIKMSIVLVCDVRKLSIFPFKQGIGGLVPLTTLYDSIDQLLLANNSWCLHALLSVTKVEMRGC